MKKVIAFILVAMAVGTVVFAQNSGNKWYNSYAPGLDQKVMINAGFGSTGSSNNLSVSADFKLPIKLPITLGGIFIYSGVEDLVIDNDNIGFGVRGMYHFNFVKNLDVYAGAMLGYAVKIESDSEKKDAGSFLYCVGAGARYFFTKNIGAYFEWIIPYLSYGVAVKF